MYEQNYVDLLQASIDLKRQEKLITTLKAENEMLRAQMKILQCRMQKLKQTMLQEQARALNALLPIVKNREMESSDIAACTVAAGLNMGMSILGENSRLTFPASPLAAHEFLSPGDIAEDISKEFIKICRLRKRIHCRRAS